ncbi:MAG TPA: extracellular solute-binding protein, partial [Nonomuraea sp.]|nr:extracellular solute-binding protein [Nonomuraea sp.]
MTGGSTRLQGRTRRLLGVMAVAVLSATAVGCGSNSGSSAGSSADGTVTLEFAQWWAPELPAGSFDKLMTEFTAQNPKIKVKLLSGPYASTKQQLVSGAASRTLPDVVGLDGAWVSDFAKQGAIAD